MNIEIYAKLEFAFTLTEEQIRLLSQVSSLHYDSKCKGLTAKAGDGRANGLLTVWANQIAFYMESPDDEAPILTASWRDLDTLLKATELASHVLKGEQLISLEAMRSSFFGCMTQGAELQRSWVATYPAPASTVHG